MTNEKFTRIMEKVIAEIKAVAPVDTGNLRNNAIRIEFSSPNECRIYVDESIAPYMPYTNEPWQSPKWHGKKNPNENWWHDRAYNFAVAVILRELKRSLVSARNGEEDMNVSDLQKRKITYRQKKKLEKAGKK